MKRFLAITMFVAVAGAAMYAGGQPDTALAAGRGRPTNGRFADDVRGQNGAGYNESMALMIDGIAPAELSAAETEGLMLMREEEKLARDVYTALYEVWNYPVFANISRSEQQHMDAVEVLFERYDLVDPVGDNAPGVFESEMLQGLYDELVEEGRQSLVAALTVGAKIEDLDIADLVEKIDESDNEDIDLIYQNLLRGSENHMGAFTSLLERQNVTYTPASRS